jgi:hypothetical protein
MIEDETINSFFIENMKIVPFTKFKSIIPLILNVMNKDQMITEGEWFKYEQGEVNEIDYID